MMDQHMHTKQSYDCTEEIEAYIKEAKKQGITKLITTEHLDLSCCYMGGKDMAFDFSWQLEEHKRLAKLENITLGFGIEVGYKANRLLHIQEILNAYPFDLVLLSIHENLEHDVTQPGFLAGRSGEEAYLEYLNLYIEAISCFDNYDVLAHLDYLLRYIKPLDISAFLPQFEQIFSILISQGKCLECNTRFLYQKREDGYLKWIFSLYYQMGGRNISLGSDAHRAIYLQGGFSWAKDMLKEIGFSFATVFSNRQGSQVLL